MQGLLVLRAESRCGTSDAAAAAAVVVQVRRWAAGRRAVPACSYPQCSCRRERAPRRPGRRSQRLTVCLSNGSVFATSGSDNMPLEALRQVARNLGEDMNFGLESAPGCDKVSLYSLMEFLAPTLNHLSNEELKSVADGLILAFNAHKTQRRKSGEPYIIHPVAVASYLAELNLDRDTIIAGLLHDTVEDTDMVTFALLEERYGPTVRLIVEGETKVSKLKTCVQGSEKEVSAADLQQMFLAMTEDLRVILVKLADRLHNMRTLDSMPRKKQERISRETLTVFAPLANLLGLYRMKTELEDLSFRYICPDVYSDTVRHLDALSKEQEEFLLKIKQALEELMAAKAEDISCEVILGQKTAYEVYKKVSKDSALTLGEALETQRPPNLEDLRNVATVTLILGPNVDSQVCYQIMGIIHKTWPPLPSTVKDFIAVPKTNGYQSLHTTVIPSTVAPTMKPDAIQTEPVFPIDIQIRTADMHQLAEFGVASQASMLRQEISPSEQSQRVSWIDSIRVWQRELVGNMAISATEFVDTVKSDLLSGRVFVFTPKGERKDLPKGSTIVDYAYHIHRDVGNTLVWAKVNGNIVRVDYVLQNGNVVEIMCHPAITAKSIRRHRQWQSVAKTKLAILLIQKFLRENADLGDDTKRNGDIIYASSNLLPTSSGAGGEIVPDFDGRPRVITSLPKDGALAEGVSFVSSGKNADVDSVAAAAEETIIATAQFDAAVVDASKQNGGGGGDELLDSARGVALRESLGSTKQGASSLLSEDNGNGSSSSATRNNGYHSNSSANGNYEFFRDVATEIPDAWRERPNGFSSDSAGEAASSGGDGDDDVEDGKKKGNGALNGSGRAANSQVSNGSHAAATAAAAAAAAAAASAVSSSPKDETPVVKMKIDKATIDVLVSDRRGLLAEISDLLYQSGLSVSRHLGYASDSSGRGLLKFEVSGVADVTLLDRVREIESVIEVKLNYL